MSKDKTPYKIPFSKIDNGLISYTYSLVGVDNNIVEWRDNYVFEDSLKYTHYNGGRSSMSMLLKSTTTGIEYNMFWKYFDQCIRRENNTPGPTFHGKWTFIKTGQNYSIKPA